MKVGSLIISISSVEEQCNVCLLICFSCSLDNFKKVYFLSFLLICSELVCYMDCRQLMLHIQAD